MHRSSRWWIALIVALASGLGAMQAHAAGKGQPTFGAAKGEGVDAKSAGTITVTLKWTKNGVEDSKSVDVAIAKGNSIATVADKIRVALKDDANISADWTVGAVDNTLGILFTTKLTPKAGVAHVSSKIVNGEGASEVKGIGLAGGSDPPPFALCYFGIRGVTARTDDVFGIRLSETAVLPDTSALRRFSLNSYAGLTPSQIEDRLALLIDADPVYTAKLADYDHTGDSVVVVTGESVDIGVVVYSSTTDSLTTPSLSGTSGILVGQILPVSRAAVATMALLILSLGTIALTRRRNRYA